jgi:amidase
MTELCDLTAVELRRMLGAKQISPVELLSSCERRIAEVNPTLNAVTATCWDRARNEAKAAEAKIRRGETLGVLEGLPLGVKDLNETEGLRTTWGSPIWKDHVPAKDERMVAACRAAGAIVVGKTNVPEFGAGANTNNPVYGPTRNPFDLARICGGSSGGSAVALAASMLPICTGSDTGGSLRTPAALCGIVGFRVSPGTVPTERRPLGWTNISVQGRWAATSPTPRCCCRRRCAPTAPTRMRDRSTRRCCGRRSPPISEACVLRCPPISASPSSTSASARRSRTA